MTLLKVSDIRRQQEGRDFALRGISFEQRQFQKIAVMGESGSGKSTLLKIISGLTMPNSGMVLFEGQRVRERLVPGHPGIAYLSQHFELRNNYRVEELLMYANALPDEEAAALYRICEIDHLLKRKTDQLSGGEKQRIALARLLVASPRLLLLDEPFSNLDLIHKNTLKSVIRDIGDKLKITCLLVSHDPQDILPWADELIMMKDGCILQQGPPLQIYRQPADAYVAGLLGRYNQISAVQAKALGITSGDTTLFIRPEQFKIVSGGSYALQGIVKELFYFGNAYEAEVQLPDGVVTIRTETGNIAQGDVLHIALKPN